MALIRQAIPALWGGVSQQAAVVRAVNQCESAVNTLFTVAKGASKRPPLECLTEITSEDWGDARFDFITTAAGLRFLLVIPGNGKLDVYRMSDGAKLTGLGTQEPVAYLRSKGPARDAFRVYSVGDTTYILNREVTVQHTDSKTTGTLGGTAQSLADDVLDGAANGYVYRILGDESMVTTGYWAKKINDKWIEWVEPGIHDELNPATMPHIIRVRPDDVNPLGHVWEFAPTEWGKREVGSEDDNKMPSFVGKKINAIFFVSDRLGFLSENNIILSETGEEHHRNFFRTTVLDVLDSDRIDVSVATDGVSHLRWARPIGKSIILSSDDRQFSLDWNNALTPHQLSITEAMAYPASGNTEPTSAGPNVYWITGTDQFGSMLEMFVQDMTLTTDATNVTSHVPHYLPLPVTHMVAHTNLDALFVHSGAYRDRLYVYKYFWAGDQKVQSSWSYWQFEDCKLLTSDVIGDRLWLLYQTDGKTFLGSLNLRTGDAGLAQSHGFEHPVHLDQLVLAPSQYNEAEDRTYFSSPYPITVGGRLEKLVLVKTKDYGPNEAGRILVNNGPLQFHPVSPNSFYVEGKLSGRVLMGLKFEQVFTFSEQFYVENERAQLNARVQLRNMAVSFESTGAFRTRVKVRGSEAAVNQVVPDVELVSAYASRTLGDEYFTLGRPNLQSGVYRFPVYGRTSDVEISLINDTYLPSNFLTAEWEALVTTRTR